MQRIVVLLLLASAALSGCGVNPVTGEKEFQFVSAGQEVAIGEQQYSPSRQMQGGDYLAHPEVTAYVRSVGERLAVVSDRALPYEFVVINSSVPNAWALPGGKIAVNRGLLTELGSEAELAAVLGHEIVHSAARHGARSMERGMMLQGALVALSLSVDDNRYSNLIVGGASLGAQLITTKYGRDAELESDLYGMRYMSRAGYNPGAAVDLQQTFVRLSQGHAQGWLDGLFASHPPATARVEANRTTAAELGDVGEMGTASYAAAIKPLIDAKPAYEAHERAVAALREGNLDAARKHAGNAIRLEPNEAQFHALLGDVAASKQRYQQAVGYYDDAIQRNPDFFQFYLGRGLAQQQLGRPAAAQRDLGRSVELLPTATAHAALGDIAARKGLQSEAVEHYRIAATSQSEVGQAAAISLVTLELPANPGAYLQTDLRVDSRGDLIVLIANRAPVGVKNVRLSLGLLDASGQGWAERRPLSVRQTIGAGQQFALQTGIGPFTEQAQLDRVRVRVDAAAVAD